MFMDFLGYGNHVELYSEEISRGGEGLGVSIAGSENHTDESHRTHRKHFPMLLSSLLRLI